MNRITGSIVALATPFQSDLSVDFAALRKLIDWHIEQGTDCIGVVGTSGESPTVTTQEHREIIRVSVEQARGRVPIMAGCGANSTHEAVALAKFAASVGADCQLQVVPYYNKPTQEGLFQHFKAISEAEDLPLVLYNVPKRTNLNMLPETTLRLAQLPGIIGIKDASADLDHDLQIICNAPEHFSIYSGDDGSALALMLSGGHGNVSVTANIAPRKMHDMCKAAVAGDRKTALALLHQLTPLNQALFIESNPIPLKWAMARMGLCQGHLRLPLTPLSAAAQSVLEQALKKTGLI